MSTGAIRIEGNAVGSAIITGTGNIVNITYAADVLRSSRPPANSHPYRGLDAFDETSAQFFFGREEVIRAFLNQLQRITAPPLNPNTHRLVGLIGPSGCGKSSILRAGLLPALAQIEAPWLRQPRVSILRPGFSPIESLADALARVITTQSDARKHQTEFATLFRDRALAGKHDGLSALAQKHLGRSPLILIVDQFEETYTLRKSSPDGSSNQKGKSDQDQKEESVQTEKSERDAFVTALLRAAADPAVAVSVIISLRSDFLGALAEHPELSKAVAVAHEIVPTMGRDDLERAIAEPAKLAQHSIDHPTVARILEEARSEAALPLVEFALERIWKGMRADVPPGETLTQIHGVGGALAHRADEVFSALTDSDRRIAKRAFLATVQLGDQASRDTRRRAWLDELVPAGIDQDSCRKAIEAFVKARLLAVGATAARRIWIELPHEALIRHWQSLRNWVEVHREDIRFARKALAAAQAWDSAHRPRGSLWRTPDLELLQQYASRNHEDLTELQVEFLAASERQAKVDWWFVRGMLAAILTLLISILVVFVLFLANS